MSGTAELLRRLSDADRDVPERVAATLPAIARAADAIAGRLENGGRWFYTGAGTSGRLGALDAAEIPPTFGTDPSLVVALMAGGPRALTEAVEGAEDDEAAGARDLDAAGLSGRDAVVGIAASGATPYVRAAVQHARKTGALTVAVVCRPGTPLLAEAEIPILVDVGPEVLKESSRMRAGTAQKLVLNMLSTAVMAKRGLVFRDEMVAMKPTNEKLRRRAVRIVTELTGVETKAAEELLGKSNWHLPTALVAAKWGLDCEIARLVLSKKKGNVALALSSSPRRGEP
ncbi:MAG TPA: N-acetylmuramic acid 6-phosphate etherase [Thermoanaerobaculia bacterium]|nr:N-acetylmuramic acid 6-phosphate etherase [Thermoanaerobaculia bacterium]HQR67419.1 N-acetylmuramic acid 6-phosphate etherase [Thermoanaerobaculia bacterium]